jgi:hypothetical protein
VNDELERIWKEAVMVFFKAVSRHSSGGTEEMHENAVRIVGLLAEI